MCKLERQKIQLERQVSADALRAIQRYVEDETGTYIWASDFVDMRMVNKEGRFAKRVAKLVKEKKGIRLTGKQVEHIGNLANNLSAAGGREMSLAVEDTIGYMTAGEFGDSGACFYASHSDHRHAMANDSRERFFVAKVWNENGNGLARAWVYVDPDDGAIVPFNAYGLSLFTITTLLATRLEREMRPVKIRSDVYLNVSDVWAIGGQAESYGFWPVDEWNGSTWRSDTSADRGRRCEGCGEWVGEDDVRHYGDDPYCEGCYNDRFFYCDGCYEDYDQDDGYSTESGWYCDTCYHHRYVTCDRCDEAIHRDGDVSCYLDSDDHTLCEYCYERYASYCEECEQYRYNRDMSR